MINSSVRTTMETLIVDRSDQKNDTFSFSTKLPPLRTQEI